MNKNKPNAIPWIDGFPTEWKVKRFGLLFSFGKGLSITKEDLQDEGVPCVSYGEIHSRYGFEVSPERHLLRCVDTKYLRTDKSALLQFGDFLFADTSEDIEGSGNFTYLNSKVTTFAGYHTIRARANEVVNFRYIAYIFDSLLFRTQIRAKVSGVKVYSITHNILKDTKLLLPPLPEQNAITAFLDEKCSIVDSIIKDMNEQIDILNQYKKTVITETITKGLDKNAPMKVSGIEWIGKIPAHWEIKRLKYLLRNPLQYGANETGEPFEENEIRYIRITDITLDNKLKDEDKLSLPLKIAKPYLLQDGDILFARSGATVGKTFLYHSDYGISAFAGYMIKADCDRNKYLSLFVYYSTLSVNYEQWLQLVFTQATIQNIGANKYENLYITCPPVDEQQKIIAYLNSQCAEINKLISDKQASIQTMQDYKKSLIYEYTTGKKRVKGFV
jgi:type I restriction enzyme S subunit